MPQILFFRENDLQPREMAGIIIYDSCSYGGILKNSSILHHFKKWKHSTFVKLKKHLKLIIYPLQKQKISKFPETEIVQVTFCAIMV